MEPYLDVLPRDVVPRLDTFDEEELAALRDQDLHLLARDSLQSLQRFWNHHYTTDTDTHTHSTHSEVQDLLLAMIRARVAAQGGTLQSSSDTYNNAIANATNLSELHLSTCTSFEAFHKYMSIVSSRAMVLHGTKYLTPLADMANYAPRNHHRHTTTHSHDSTTPRRTTNSFTLHHQLNATDQSITVRADRSFHPHEQIFEDYGHVDNSLYLEAHGFVPAHNPHHCAVISPTHYPVRPQHIDDNVWNAAVKMGIVPPPSATTTQPREVPILCVMSDGSLNDSRAAAYLRLAALFDVKGKGPDNPLQQRRCVDSVRTGDVELITLQCVRYGKHGEALRDGVRESARRAVCGADSSLEDDVALLEGIAGSTDGRHGAGKGKDTYRMETAIKFRISDKRILSFVGEVEGTRICPSSNDRDFDEQVTTAAEPQPPPQLKTETKTETETELKTETQPSRCLPRSEPATTVPPSHKNLTESLHQFTTFLDTLNLPVRKIEPALVDNGMRIGAIATEDLTQGEPYHSIDTAATLSVDTVVTPPATVDDARRVGAVLGRYRAQPGDDDDDGGFDGLLFVLMYETFVGGEGSGWGSYLRLLPTVADLERSSPLLFNGGGNGGGDGGGDDDEMLFDALAGSDVRRKLLDYRRRARDAYREFSLDYDVVMAMGIEHVTEENYLWARSIVDTRSIWWDGKRHLVPLLDLVNCSELRNHNGSPTLPHRTQTIPDKSTTAYYAVTEATAPFQRGQQVYENYAQPNYVYLLYHGFVLDHNSYDCALWEDASGTTGSGSLRITANDAAAKDMARTKNRLTLNNLPSSPSPSFCIKDGASLDRVANFVRIKLGIDGDNLGVVPAGGSGDDDDDGAVVLDFIEDALRRRLERYAELGHLRELDYCRVEGGGAPSFRTAMETIVTREISFFRKAYDDLRELRSLGNR